MEFINTGKRLTIKEVQYWKQVFKKNLLIGTEIEIMFDEEQDVDTSDIRSLIGHENIGSSYNQYNNFIESVKTDGSLRNGVEIVTAGKRLYDFMERFVGYQFIYNKLIDESMVISPRMGWHNHLLLQYNSTSTTVEHPVPCIILNNFIRLIQRFYPALVFMTSTMPEEDLLTRYDEFCEHYALKNFNGKTHAKIRDNFTNKYNAVGTRMTNYNSDGDITTFHVELRFPDGVLAPVYQTTMNFVFKAMLLKAIELSQHGFLDNSNYLNEDLYRIKNNSSFYPDEDEYGNIFKRYEDSDTRYSCGICDSYIEDIKLQGIDFYNFISNELYSLDRIAHKMAYKFIDKPISLMFDELDTYDIREVNNELENMLEDMYTELSDKAKKIYNYIAHNTIGYVSTRELWIEKVAMQENFTIDTVDICLDEINNKYPISFNSRVGVYFI